MVICDYSTAVSECSSVLPVREGGEHRGCWLFSPARGVADGNGPEWGKRATAPSRQQAAKHAWPRNAGTCRRRLRRHCGSSRNTAVRPAVRPVTVWRRSSAGNCRRRSPFPRVRAPARVRPCGRTTSAASAARERGVGEHRGCCRVALREPRFRVRACGVEGNRGCVESFSACENRGSCRRPRLVC